MVNQSCSRRRVSGLGSRGEPHGASRGRATPHTPHPTPVRVRRTLAAASLALFFTTACVRTRTEIVAPLAASPSAAVTPPPTEPAAARREAEGPTALVMRRVDFHVAPGVVLHVRHLAGALVRTDSAMPVTFDDERSFVIRVATGDAGLTMPDLGRLLNGYVFAYPNAPLIDLRATADGDRLRLRGKLRKGGDVPFDIVAAVSATPRGEIRVHPLSIHVAKLPAGPLLKLVGLRLDRLVNLRGSRGARVSGNDIYLLPDSALPPPTVRGHLAAARVEGDEMRLVFDDPSYVTPPAAPHADSAANYLSFHGGTLRIGKLFMVHADLEIVDAAPVDPLDFSLAAYVRQLVAGYVKNTPAGGLVVHVPDLHTLDEGGAGPAPP